MSPFTLLAVLSCVCYVQCAPQHGTKNPIQKNSSAISHNSSQLAVMTARVDGIKELQMTINVDRNVVVCQAAKSRNGKTSIILVTPKDAWTKEFVITSDSVFGYHLKCGDRYGTLMQGLNGNNKYNKVELPVVGPIAIQFLKAKTFGIMTDYGTMTLPKFPTGYTVVFFWPNDAPGDHWNNFMDIIKQGEHAIEAVAGIANNVIKIGQSAASLLALFA